MDTDINKAIDYCISSLKDYGVDDLDIRKAARDIYQKRVPLYMANETLSVDINDFMEEYGEDNDLPEGWWQEFGDEEDIFFEIAERWLNC